MDNSSMRTDSPRTPLIRREDQVDESAKKRRRHDRQGVADRLTALHEIETFPAWKHGSGSSLCEDVLEDETIHPFQIPEEVELIVPTTDDIAMPVSTFRAWMLGILACVGTSFVNQFFWFRTEPLSITSVFSQIAVLPLGRIMAATLPHRRYGVPGTDFRFSLNPGPFNKKEHVLITVMANAGASSVYAIHIVSIVKIFYKKTIQFYVAFLLVLTTQILGFGWAGLFRKFLIEPATMWWPSSLVQVSLFRALHEEDQRPRGQLSRNQFFVLAISCSFAYYLFPGYLFPMLTSLSWLCWVFPSSVVAQQIGSGLKGLGLGAIGLDWSAICAYYKSPLATPWFAVANMMVGFVITTYIIIPLAYSRNLYEARRFPIFSSGLFTQSGEAYDTSKVLNGQFELDLTAYANYGKLYLSDSFVFTYAIGFASLAATLVHVLLFHGRDLWRLGTDKFRNDRKDLHTRMMEHYKQVPVSWFLFFLFITIIVSIVICEVFNEQLQLSWWGVLLACALALLFTLPLGIINSTTNQTVGLNIIAEYLIGLLCPGQPLTNVCFKTYGYYSVTQALTFLTGQKLGHYMKIPPRPLLAAQLMGTVIACTVYLMTAWWLLSTIPNICDTSLLPVNSLWTCPADHVFFDASVVWGLIGPRRIFGDLGLYKAANWFFLVGAIAPILVWLLCKWFPKASWLRFINMPILLGATAFMPPATPVNLTSWCIMGFLFSFVIFRYRRAWWQRYNYVLSSGLDAGVAFMGILVYACLGSQNISLDWWGSSLDGCPLAHCPTIGKLVVKGCPLPM